MSTVQNPALDAFVKNLGEELALAQVLIRRAGAGFELRHVVDRDRAAEALKLLAVPALRELAQFSAEGNFRPLKSSPNLRSGWRTHIANAVEMDAAMNHLYPGGIADWYAARSASPPVTNYREFTNRQTGMYRITTMLSDAQAADVIRAGCHQRFCLKRRLWTVEGLAIDNSEEKSILPCLEPCPVLLEFARKAMRIEQEEKVMLPLTRSDCEALSAALEAALAHPDTTLREADFNSPGNPRRQQLVNEKLKRVLNSLAPLRPDAEVS
jgi:hypothetical protein